MMEKIKNFYGAHPIRWTIIGLALVIGVCALCYFFPALGLKAADIPAAQSTLAAPGEALPVEGVVTVAQEGGRTLTIDTKTLELVLKDDATGMTWSSVLPGAKPEDTSALALLEVTFRGEDNVEKVWNTYSNCVTFGTYELYQIENGVQVKMNINEGNSKVYLEYLPARFPQERYEQFILPSIDQLLADGVITDNQHTRYLDMLHQCYRLNPKGEPFYDQFFSGNSPAPSLRDSLIDLTLKIGYTKEMLIEDCALNGTVPTFHEPAQFNLVAEFTLDGGDLVAHIPTGEITAGNPFYMMQRIAVLPNLVAEIASAENDGYYLTPDGSGALMRFNSFVGSMTKYDRPYMDNNYYADYYFQSEFAEELRMPIFGVINGVEPATHGMLAIIEDGADTANLHITLGSSSGTGKKKTFTGTNKAYISVDTLEHASVKIKGAYATDGPSFVANSGHIVTDFTVRFRPYTSEVTYFDMAMDYRDHLSTAASTPIAAPAGPKAFVEVIGAVTLIDRIAGIPYDNITSMTSYDELSEIIQALPAGSVVQYDGGFNGGLISELNNGARLVKENGKRAALDAALKTAASTGTDLFFQVNLSRVYVNGRNYLPYFHALRDFSNASAEIYLYTPDTAMFNGRWDPIRSYTRVSPKYLPTLAQSFVDELQKQGLDINLAAGDLAHDVFADLRYNNVINQVQANALVNQALDLLDADADLVLNDPDAVNAVRADYITNVSRTSSQYASFAATIPFRQLALSGLTQLVGQDVNLNSRSVDYYLLQAAELGMGVKYTVSYKNPDVLKNSHFESLYAASWTQWQEEIIGTAKKLEELREAIGSHVITNHVMLSEDVFETTYESGVRIITNYTCHPYESADGVVAPQTYLMVKEGAQ